MAENEYRRVILPQAEDDIEETLKYISEELHNPTAADKLLLKMIEAMKIISVFPYSSPTIKDERVTLGNEYRRANIENFVLIYKVVEESKEIRIMAAFYGPSDVNARLLKRI